MVASEKVQSAQTVIYRPNEHADEYIVFIDDEAEYNAWKEDKSIALARFVGQFSIFKSSTSGHTGTLGEVSKQEIENVFFGDEKNVKDKSVEAAILIILKSGTVHKGNMEHSGKMSKNDARGGANHGTGAFMGR
ncbi:ribosome maturation protein [Dioszegia hungarica]|uniref:Ribosome maturation protein n=1 Tax=Dioszegia hungarica TaxID=4972 RepID=A0AA38HC54_9TREE|nr:ribosome maturation protein [Dioszegia hungarica]KAI9637780.1 ribosome maturation protein [Dioszegia hungarica]